MQQENRQKTHLIQGALFLLTLATTTFAGAEWIHNRSVFFGEDTMEWADILHGFYYSIPFLGILTVHEFGHYFTAKYHKVNVSLPYYIPFWLGSFFLGTMGAFIKIKDAIHCRKEFFDIGIAGPLAGFVVALCVLFYGFTHLPEPEYIFQAHPEYAEYGLDYADHVYGDGDEDALKLEIGNNIIFWWFSEYIADPERMPNKSEVIHYPFLFAGFLALFFTALNLIPIGQLDGGHILYGLVGYKHHKRISSGLFLLFVGFAGLGIPSVFKSPESILLDLLLYGGFLFIVFKQLARSRQEQILIALAVFSVQLLINYIFPNFEGFYGWLAFSFLLGRVLGIHHPRALEDRPLSQGRKWLGWLALLIFVLCYSPAPFVFT